MKPNKLDKYWKVERGLRCPFCNNMELWNDTHNEKDATHYCAGCDEGILIVGNCALREKGIK